MAGGWVPPGKQRFTDPLTDAPMIGGLVYNYIPNTDTPKDTWQDQALTVLNTNPIVLDGEGECIIWGDGLYRQRVTDAAGNPVWDQITGFVAGGTGSDDWNDLTNVPSNISAFSALVGSANTIPYFTGAGAMATTPFSATGRALVGAANPAAALAVISPLTTKGDLFTYGPTNARLPVGADGSVLTADSAQALGVKWATTSGVQNMPNFVTVFGGNNDGITSNNTPITNANAYTSGYQRTWVPEGLFLTTLSNVNMANLRMVGPGRIIRANVPAGTGYTYWPQLRTMNTNPGYNDDPLNNPYGQNNVSHFADAEIATIQQLSRIHPTPLVAQSTLNGATLAGATSAVLTSILGFATGQTARFGSVATPAAESRSITLVGSTVAAGLAIGDVTCTVASGAGFAIGQVVGFTGAERSPVLEVRTLTNVVGNVLTWVTGLANAYPVTSTFVARGISWDVSLGLTNPYASGQYVSTINVSRDYFGMQWTPKVIQFNTNAGTGYSGATTRMFGTNSAATFVNSTVPAGIAKGAVTCTMTSGVGFAIGQCVSFRQTSTGPVLEQRVLTNVVGAALTWVGGLANAYPVTTPVVQVSNTCTLASGVGFTTGDAVGFAPDASSAFAEVRTLTNVAGNVITWSTASPLWYTPAAARAALGVVAGATSCNVISAAGLTTGDTVGFGGDQDGPWTDTKEITVAGTVISWTGGLGYSYPMISGYVGPIMSKGSRTSNTPQAVIHNAHGGGDNFGYFAIVNMDYAKTAGQVEPANAATGSVLNGLVTLSGDGLYGTCTELYVTSTSGNNSGIADIRVMTRTDDTWTGVPSYWGGYYLIAAGAVACDWGFVLQGPWRVGIDFCGADLSAGSQAAVNLKNNQRIYLNSQSAVDYTGLPVAPYNGKRGNNFYGNYLGDAYIGHSSSAVSLVKGAAALSLTATSLVVNVATEVTSLYGDVNVSSPLFNIYDSGPTLRGHISISAAAGVNSVDIYSGATYRLKIKDDGGMSFNGSLTTAGYISSATYLKSNATTFAGLPAAGTADLGARYMITDSSVVTFGSNAAGGGGSIVPVYSTGAVWVVG